MSPSQRIEARRLEALLHEDIPLTQAMQVGVAGYDGQCLRLTAPLEPNINHKLTAFGGSLYSLAVLCGWGLIHLKLAKAGLHRHIVIQESSIRYLRPMTSDIVAACRADEAALDRFLRTLQGHGRARLKLDVTIGDAGETAVAFSGRYVVHE